MSQESVTLFFREGGSDKVYQAQLEPKADGWVVSFQYGRRGSTLQSGTKTTSPVSYEKAKKVYDTLVLSKTSKGYTPAEGGTPFTDTDKAGQVSGLVPQLLNAIDESRAQELIEGDSWFAQEKMDGIHQMTRRNEDGIIGSNRKGLIVPLAESIALGIKVLFPRGGVGDGEAIGDNYWPFDLLEFGNDDLRKEGARTRWNALSGLVQAANHPNIRLVRTAFGKAEKRRLFEAIRAEKGEGIVFKKIDAPYTPGKPPSGGTMLKFKFKGSATCIVVAQNDGKRSVQIAVAGDGPILVGNVTIPPNTDMPAPKTFVEVKYLYAHPGGSLFQPVYKGLRPDKDCADHYSTLKFKQGTAEEGEG